MKIINRTVLILSFVSLFADMASEMLYPVIPVYLQTIGFSILLRDAQAAIPSPSALTYFTNWNM